MIKDNSLKVKKGDIFIAIGKGHDYIEDAISKGASLIICEYGDYSVDTLIVADTHEYLVEYLYNNYYDDIKDINLIGMTGTNGKTTTCFLLYQALNMSGIKTGYIGTIGFYMEDKVRDISNTTPDILAIYEMLLECKKNGISHVVMEVSSHSLKLDRVKGLVFKYGIFSNLTRDHLDFHLTMEDYLDSKLKLFDMVSDKTFVNVDDLYSDYFIRENSITYGFSDCNYKICDYKLNLNKTKFKLNEKTYNINLIGKHNLYNMCVVIAVLEQLGLDDGIVNELIAPKGRFEQISYGDNTIIIDYAHTPDALENVLKTVEELDVNNIYTIVGCGGNRDKSKRSMMGDIATKYSDYVIFTSDNPRFEKKSDILKDIVNKLTVSNYETEINREIAIKKGIQLLDKNDILLVLGKGHEDYQIIKNKKIHFDDKEIVMKYI